MKPTEKMGTFLRRGLPKEATPTSVIPRAYCIAKPAPGMAVFVTPPEDWRGRRTEIEMACNAGISFHGKETYALRIGDWRTLVYATRPGAYLWYVVDLLPWRLLT